MRVLHLTRDYPPRSNGGLSVAVPALVAAGRERGVEARIASFDAWRPRGGHRTVPSIADTPAVVRLRAPDDLPRLHARARAFEPDVVHVHDALLFEEARRLARPVVFHAHVLQGALRRLRGLDAPTRSEEAEAVAIREATVVLAPTEAAASAVAREDVRVVPFAVALPPPLPEGARLAEGPILFVGRFADVKGVAELFAAIGLVTRARPGARFVVAGGLPDNPRAERRWRERFLREAGPNGEAATRFAGWCDRAALDALYRDAALLVAPSWTETFGLAVAEAMAHGVPIVASDVPALRERVPPDAGRLVPPRDPTALADAILELLAAPPERARLGAGARAAAAGWAGSVAAPLHAAYLAAAAGGAPR